MKLRVRTREVKWIELHFMNEAKKGEKNIINLLMVIASYFQGQTHIFVPPTGLRTAMNKDCSQFLPLSSRSHYSYLAMFTCCNLHNFKWSNFAHIFWHWSHSIFLIISLNVLWGSILWEIAQGTFFLNSTTSRISLFVD